MMAMTGGGDGGQVGSGDGGQIGSGDGGQIGSGDGGQIGSGDGGQIGSGDGGQVGSGDGGQVGSGTGGRTGGGYGSRAVAADPRQITVVGPVVIAQKLLRFRIQRQEHSEWCWAAVAASINNYFDPASKLEQCTVANRVLRHKIDFPDDECCGGCDGCKCCCHPHLCNRPEELEEALKKIYKWRNTLERALRFDEVQREIDNGRPIGVGITWISGNDAPGSSSNGHFVVIRGYRILSNGARQVYVADPLNASGLVDFDEFRLAYYGEGQWTETDFVQSGWA
jgi:hypothetical protein